MSARRALLALLLLLLTPRAAQAQWSTSPGSAVPITQAPGMQYGLVSASDLLGGAWFAFEDHASDPLTRVRVQHLDLRGVPLFGDTGVVLTASTGKQLLPRLAADGAGDAFLTWVDFRADTAGDLYAQRITRAGTPAWPGGGIALCAVPLAHTRVV